MSVIRLSVTENVLSDAGRVTEAMYIDLLERSGRAWVADDEGQVVAFCYANKLDGSIWALFVRPGHEGRGYGQALLKHATDWLFQLGHDRVQLSTTANTRADRFYAQLGWQRQPVSATEATFSITNDCARR